MQDIAFTSSAHAVRVPLAACSLTKRSVFDRAILRTVELMVATVVLLVGLPLWLVISLLLKLESPGPIFYRSRRVGRDGREFEMLKFRTMHRGADLLHLHRARVEGGAGTDPFVTRVGLVLRRTGLDEVPQFLHVLTGKMAIVGPRPYVPADTYRMPEELWRGRMQCKPGLTGLWQLSGTALLPYEESVALDLDYLARANLWLDLLLMARTPAFMLKGRHPRS